MSRPCSPACGAPRAGLRSRRRRCCRSMSWRCSNSSPHRAYGTCATGRSCFSASSAACARSEIAGLVMSPEDSLVGSGWPEFFEKGVILTLRGKTGWREVEIGRGPSERTCPVAALEAWLKFARILRGPVFRAVVGRAVGAESLNDRHVARLVKRLAVAAGVRGDLSERDREEKFSWHSLPAGLASSAEIDERYPETPRPRVGGNDPPLPAASRPLPRQSHQGGGAVIEEIGRHCRRCHIRLELLCCRNDKAARSCR